MRVMRLLPTSDPARTSTSEAIAGGSRAGGSRGKSGTPPRPHPTSPGHRGRRLWTPGWRPRHAIEATCAACLQGYQPAIVPPGRDASASSPETQRSRSSALRGRRPGRVPNAPGTSRAVLRLRHPGADGRPPKRQVSAPSRCRPNRLERRSLWQEDRETSTPGRRRPGCRRSASSGQASADRVPDPISTARCVGRRRRRSAPGSGGVRPKLDVDFRG